MNAKYPWLEFQYADPEPNFDRSQVHGVAAKLFTVKDPRFCVALDTVAGGKVNILTSQNRDTSMSYNWNQSVKMYIQLQKLIENTCCVLK